MSYPHTEAQTLAIALAKNNVLVTIHLMLRNAKDLQDSIVDLPHKNEKGESIVHGSNMRVYNLGETLTEAANSLLRSLDRDDADEICSRFGYKRSLRTFS